MVNLWDPILGEHITPQGFLRSDKGYNFIKSEMFLRNKNTATSSAVDFQFKLFDSGEGI